MHITAPKALKITIYPLQTIQIFSSNRMQIVALKQIKASTKVLTKYSNFSDIFLKKNILMLLKQIKLNNHAIKLKDDKQSSYRLIYSLNLVELKTLKTYIETYLKTRFI